jgi:DUF2971 family protein
MTDDELRELFSPLWAEFQGEDCFPNRRPLLTHYTKLPALESILQNNEVWFSHPLLMNDPEEVGFGLDAGNKLFFSSAPIEAACETPRRLAMLRAAFAYWFKRFANEDLPKTFVLCLSEHAPEDNNGLLSMWNLYGDQCRGTAIVIDTAQIVGREGSFLILARVRYGTRDERIAWLDALVVRCADIIAKNRIPDDKLHLCAFYIFQRLKTAALFTKHDAYREEKEWRVVYMRDMAESELLNHMIDYWNGPRGLEPKLKLKLAAITGLPETESLSLSMLTDRILLGPIPSPLALQACASMVEACGHPELRGRIRRSAIPYRG